MEGLELQNRIELNTIRLIGRIYDYFLDCLASSNQYDLGEAEYFSVLKVYSKDEKISRVNFEHYIVEVNIEVIIKYLKNNGFTIQYVDNTNSMMAIHISNKKLEKLLEVAQKKIKTKVRE